jgi:general secretion pathway protein A
MYEAFFALSKRPFASTPRVDQYYPATGIETARQTLARCVERAEGVGLVVGPSGTGKTLLCRMLAQQFQDGFDVVLLSSGRLSTRRALLQAILFELGLPYRGMDEGELRLALMGHLTPGEDSPQGMLLLVDEAHTLPLRLVEEVRMITNVVADGQPQARLVLAGASILEERLASPKLDSFSQRIVARCYLESLNREETQAYVHAQIEGAGGCAEEVFPGEACHAVYQATDGVPRLVNQVCDHALLLACAGGRRQVDRAAVEEAWADLQQLPPPWSGDSQDEQSGGVVEFGGLDDEADEPEAEADPSEPAEGQGASVPMLRISPEADEPGADPAERIEQIQDTLSQVDDDFVPAGSIGPELELVFDDRDDPFNEKFEEEEVIVDRYEQAQQPKPGKEPQPCVEEPTEESCAAEPVQTPSALAQGAEPDDGPILIVEDDYHDPHEVTVPSGTRVRRLEYGQLFARLRRSS